MGSTDAETPLAYRMMVPRFEDMNDELDFIDQQFCDIDADITDQFEWARKAANCGNIKTLTRAMLMKPKITKETLADQLLYALTILNLILSTLLYNK